MMDVLIYLFETCIDYNETELVLEQGDLSQELIDIGFQANDVQRAFEWLEDLAEEDGDLFHFISPMTVDPDDENGHALSQRIYTKEELLRLDEEGLRLLSFLEHGRFITPMQREYILSYVVKLEQQPLSLEQFKWMILMVLFNAPDSEPTYELLDQYFYESEYSLLH